LEAAKSITQSKGLNGEGLLQLTHQVDMMKDDKKLAKVIRGSDVHVKPKKVDMLTYVSLK
jgi:hypothetical protein